MSGKTFSQFRGGVLNYIDFTIADTGDLWVIPAGVKFVDVLAVAGGGGGDDRYSYCLGGGGGGGGQVATRTINVSNHTYSIIAGNATAVTTTSLQDTSKSGWLTDQWNGLALVMTSGDAAGEYREILTTSTTETVTFSAFTGTIAVGDGYEIRPAIKVVIGAGGTGGDVASTFPGGDGGDTILTIGSETILAVEGGKGGWRDSSPSPDVLHGGKGGGGGIGGYQNIDSSAGYTLPVSGGGSSGGAAGGGGGGGFCAGFAGDGDHQANVIAGGSSYDLGAAAPTVGSGNNATGYGGGGSGGYGGPGFSGSATQYAGGNGAPGYCLIKWMQ